MHDFVFACLGLVPKDGVKSEVFELLFYLQRYVMSFDDIALILFCTKPLLNHRDAGSCSGCPWNVAEKSWSWKLRDTKDSSSCSQGLHLLGQ